MKTSKKYPAVEFPKGTVRPCPSGKCKHQHVKGTGPCIEIGCGCHGAYYNKKEKRS